MVVSKTPDQFIIYKVYHIKYQLIDWIERILLILFLFHFTFLLFFVFEIELIFHFNFTVFWIPQGNLQMFMFHLFSQQTHRDSHWMIRFFILKNSISFFLSFFLSFHHQMWCDMIELVNILNYLLLFFLNFISFFFIFSI